MKLKAIFLIVITVLLTLSCVSTKLTIKNIDDNAPNLTLKKDNTFLITQYSKDKKYGYHPDYPINIFYQSTGNDSINQPRFLNALAGPRGEKITYKRLEICCPFKSKRALSGAGLLDVYEIRWQGQAKPVKLYLNIYEKGVVMVPVGLSLKTVKEF
ncbi:MAG TPA: 2-dehydro-3-deoxyphosphooctonate aldolase [Flavobacterium sp.]